jgi:acetyl-CoA acetyltransferase
MLPSSWPGTLPRGEKEPEIRTRDVVIGGPVRTAIGGYGGVLKSLNAAELGVSARTGPLGRTGVDPSVIDDVILGHCYPTPDAPAIGGQGLAAVFERTAA